MERNKLVKEGGAFTFTKSDEFNNPIVQVKFEYPWIRSDLEKSEASVIYRGKPLFRDLVTLNTGDGKKAFIARLEDFRPSNDIADELYMDWRSFTEDCFGDVLDVFRHGYDPVRLTNVEILDLPDYQLQPYLVSNTINTLFGTGSSGKSLTSLYWALLLDSGSVGPTGDKVPIQKTLILDYEDTAVNYKRRLEQLMRGMGLDEMGHRCHIDYLRCTQPLIREVSKIRKLKESRGYDLIVVDSLGLAGGGGLEDSESMNNFFYSLRQIIEEDATVLLISHTNKNNQLHGSAYIEHSSRSVYRCDTSRVSPSEIYIGFFHTKVNNVPKQAPSAYSIEFRDGIRYTKEVISNTPLAKNMQEEDLALDIYENNNMSISKVIEKVGDIKGKETEDIGTAVESAINRYSADQVALSPGERLIG